MASFDPGTPPVEESLSTNQSNHPHLHMVLAYCLFTGSGLPHPPDTLGVLDGPLQHPASPERGKTPERYPTTPKRAYSRRGPSPPWVNQTKNQVGLPEPLAAQEKATTELTDLPSPDLNAGPVLARPGLFFWLGVFVPC
jgi:hypothetical protein